MSIPFVFLDLLSMTHLCFFFDSLVVFCMQCTLLAVNELKLCDDIVNAFPCAPPSSLTLSQQVTLLLSLWLSLQQSEVNAHHTINESPKNSPV